MNKTNVDMQLNSLKRKYKSLIAKYDKCEFDLRPNMAVGKVDGHAVFVNTSAYTIDVMSVIVDEVRKVIPKFEKKGKNFYIDVDKISENIVTNNHIVLTPRYFKEINI